MAAGECAQFGGVAADFVGVAGQRRDEAAGEGEVVAGGVEVTARAGFLDRRTAPLRGFLFGAEQPVRFGEGAFDGECVIRGADAGEAMAVGGVVVEGGEVAELFDSAAQFAAEQ